MENLAIVDLGSNSVRMGITQIENDGTFKEVKRVKEDTRISEGMGVEKKLTKVAMDRTIKALISFKKLYAELPNLTVRAITTAAVRQAVNQAEFLSRVQKEVGLKLQVLSGDDEAYYDFLGAVNALPLDDCIILDTGGASCELIHVAKRKAKNLISVPFGAVNLSEQFHFENIITAGNLFSGQVFVRKRLQDIWWLNDAMHLPIVLLGGANRTLARINRKAQKMVRVEDIHGYRLKTETVFDTFDRLISKDNSQRQAIDGLEYDRADIIVGGMLPLVELLQLLDSDRVIFSESGVREGIVSEYVSQHPKYQVHP